MTLKRLRQMETAYTTVATAPAMPPRSRQEQYDLLQPGTAFILADAPDTIRVKLEDGSYVKLPTGERFTQNSPSSFLANPGDPINSAIIPLTCVTGVRGEPLTFA